MLAVDLLWLGPEGVERPENIGEISREEALGLLEEPLERGSVVSDSLVESLKRKQIAVEIGDISLTLGDKDLVGDGGYKRVYSLPDSPYVVALPNKTKGHGNLAAWQYAIQEPDASNNYYEETGLLTNPDAFLAESQIEGVSFPLLVMRGWSSFSGTVLDTKNPIKDDGFNFRLSSPAMEVSLIRQHLDPAVEEVDKLIEADIVLGIDSLNLIASDDDAVMRIFATEITDGTLGQRDSLEDPDYARRYMVCRAIDTLFRHCVPTSEYFEQSAEWEKLVRDIARSYNIDY